ncbi:isopentenyl-diphosphate Delta-isomerase [Pseudobacter ginsenosidimutans]|uniref:Isopentenyl-diphosphate delta-isomerase n=1 Tax=Pseudobacter ginsenosidimutans TaxID=661488 RepID=A0A4Q7MUH5_9BACT|nr:isopentenyl-diphosphate Delta-isomerase [Pseudobacter ginsenosidimutans]QEC41022.1 isopentenyl-diphosphate Delta-isomerase [Pseudobacter ginsenosidimutans]RZS72228.1 isopentenyl-diphosphate delta-isomerase [Pseudobacter ginsenosidimutans]
MNGTQEVILVNERDEPIGTMEKIEAHRKAALHRAFSVFIFNSKGEMLLQQRALNKYHSAGLWTNACCSHPAPGEATADAAHRRLQEELGFSTGLEKIFHFTYQTAFDNGLIEHEFDHVFAGQYEQRITPNPEEVKDVCYKSLEDIQQSLQTHPQKYTSWFHIAFPKVKEWAVQQGLVQPTI